MKTRRSHALLPLCLGLMLLSAAAASHAAGDARVLDWNAPTPKQSSDPKLLPLQKMELGNPSKTQYKAEAKANPTGSRTMLFNLEDRAIIIVGGKQTTAGEHKKTIKAAIAAKVGPPKTVKGGARKPDLAALTVTSGTARTQATPQGTRMVWFPGGVPPIGGGSIKSPATSPTIAVAPSSAQATSIAPSVALKDSVSKTRVVNSLAENKCLDKGPPMISGVDGRLKPGGKVLVWGRCFGDRPGRVEIIGQFPGGKLKSAFTAWDMTGVELEIPANIRGAVDHAVAVTIVTADGRASPAMQAQFAAARERIEVPERLWSPGANFELAATSENSVNQAAQGQISRSLRVHPQCRLDTMDAVVLSGSIGQILGWELGPPHEASVTIDWVGTCTSAKSTTSYNYVIFAGNDAVTVTSACRVAFQARAWAYCPAGVAP